MLVVFIIPLKMKEGLLESNILQDVSICCAIYIYIHDMKLHLAMISFSFVYQACQYDGINHEVFHQY